MFERSELQAVLEKNRIIINQVELPRGGAAALARHRDLLKHQGDGRKASPGENKLRRKRLTQPA